MTISRGINGLNNLAGAAKLVTPQDANTSSPTDPITISITPDGAGKYIELSLLASDRCDVTIIDSLTFQVIDIITGYTRTNATSLELVDCERKYGNALRAGNLVVSAWTKEDVDDVKSVEADVAQNTLDIATNAANITSLKVKVYDYIIENDTDLNDLTNLGNTVIGSSVLIRVGSYTLSQTFKGYERTEYVFESKNGGVIIDRNGFAIQFGADATAVMTGALVSNSGGEGIISGITTDLSILGDPLNSECAYNGIVQVPNLNSTVSTLHFDNEFAIADTTTGRNVSGLVGGFPSGIKVSGKITVTNGNPDYTSWGFRVQNLKDSDFGGLELIPTEVGLFASVCINTILPKTRRNNYIMHASETVSMACYIRACQKVFMPLLEVTNNTLLLSSDVVTTWWSSNSYAVVNITNNKGVGYSVNASTSDNTTVIGSINKNTSTSGSFDNDQT